MAVSYRLIEKDDDLKALAKALSSEASFAIDSEADSLHSYEGKVCLIQISTTRENFIVDALRIGSLEPLGEVLRDESIEKVLHGSDYDIRMLAKDYGFEIRNLFDTMVAAQLLGLKGLGLAALLKDNFQIELDKGFQKADWSRRPLTKEMLDYAALDTAHLIPLRDILCSELEKKGRLKWAREEFHLLSLCRPRPKEPVSCLNVKGARGLTPRQLSVLQALLEFREGKAMEYDRPPFKVIGGEILMEIAKSVPADIDGLRLVPGVTDRILSRYGQGLMSAVRKGEAVPLEECPRFERSSGRRMRSQAEITRFEKLKAVSGRIAGDLAIDPSLLCTNASLTTISSASPSDIDNVMCATLKSWQLELLAKEFSEVFR